MVIVCINVVSMMVFRCQDDVSVMSSVCGWCVLACAGVCWRVSACVIDVSGYLEEYPEAAVVKVHAVVFY